MEDFRIEVNGVRYLCKSDKTAAAEGLRDERVANLALRSIVYVKGRNYVLREIIVVKEWKCRSIRILRSIRIPVNVEKIGEYCFYQCGSFDEIVFESGCDLKEIGNWAFSYSGLKSIRIPVNVERIGEYCFCQCGSFDEIVFESGCDLKEIGNWAFSRSHLRSIRIPVNVERIGE
jgi:hypothetical protein